MQTLSTPAVLLADDTRTSLLVLERAVASDHYRVLQASNGKEAIAQARDPGVFLIILDVRLPDMDGFAVAQAVAGFAMAALFRVTDESHAAVFAAGLLLSLAGLLVAWADWRWRWN